MSRRLALLILFGLAISFYAACPALSEEPVAGQKSMEAPADVAHETKSQPVHEAAASDAKLEHGKAQHEAAAHGEGHEGGHHSLTHVQVMNFIWHCLNFTLLVLILLKYLKKPIADSIKGRQESIAKAFEELEAKKKDAAARFKEYETKLSGMDEEAKQILENFVAQGQKERDAIIEQAKAAAERIKAQAEFYVQQELAKAKVELQKEVADAAVKMAEELIRKNLTEQDQSRLISEYLERVVHKN